MKRTTLILFVCAVPMLLGGCATTMRYEECASADWYTMGFEDGHNGNSAAQLDNYRAQCARYQITPDEPAYNKGRDEGLSIYCTPDNGYRVGSRGESYRGVCSREIEAKFIPRYDLGRRVYTLNMQLSARRSEVQSTENELYALRQQAQSIRLDSARADLTETQRYDLSLRLERVASRAGQLEERLRYLNGEILRLQSQLAAMNAP